MSNTTPTPDAGIPNTPAPGSAYPTAPAGWGAAPTPTSTSTLDAPAPGAYPTSWAGQPPAAPPDPYAASWNPAAPNGVTGAGATGWSGGTAPTTRAGRPRPPWFWPVIAVAVGLAALLAGGGAGFAIGHAIGGAHQSTTQLPGGGTHRFPGGGEFPGTSSQGGSSTNGSPANS